MTTVEPKQQQQQQQQQPSPQQRERGSPETKVVAATQKDQGHADPGPGPAIPSPSDFVAQPATSPQPPPPQQQQQQQHSAYLPPSTQYAYYPQPHPMHPQPPLLAPQPVVATVPPPATISEYIAEYYPTQPAGYPHLNSLERHQQSHPPSRSPSEATVTKNLRRTLETRIKNKSKRNRQRNHRQHRGARRASRDQNRIKDIVGDGNESDIASEAAAYHHRREKRSIDSLMEEAGSSLVLSSSDSDPNDAYEALDQARRRQDRQAPDNGDGGKVGAGGGIMGLQQALSEYDFMCPHCLGDPRVDEEPATEFKCCKRWFHYGCIAHSVPVHELAAQRVPACIQCLRPSDLAPFDIVLQRYYEAATPTANPHKTKHSTNSESLLAGGKQRIEALWQAYGALGQHLKQNGMIKGINSFLRSEDRTKPPKMDWDSAVKRGINIRTLFAAGWSLQTIARIFELDSFDDPAWKQKLQFDRNALLEMRDRDLLYFMMKYKIHPYKLRHYFHIQLQHLWRTADRRRAGSRSSRSRSPHNGLLRRSRGGGSDGRDYYVHGPSTNMSQRDLERALAERVETERLVAQGRLAVGPDRNFRTTEQACSHYGVLSPRQLAILGFDLHHMIIMGFTKAHFANFPWFSMDDWLTHLGFRRVHWDILRLNRRDFEPGTGGGSKQRGGTGDGVFYNLVGWRLDPLTRRWRLSPNDMFDMGILDSDQLEELLEGENDPPPPALHQQRRGVQRAPRELPQPSVFPQGMHLPEARLPHPTFYQHQPVYYPHPAPAYMISTQPTAAVAYHPHLYHHHHQPQQPRQATNPYGI